MQLAMSCAGSLAMPASFLGSGRVFVSLPVHFMHADGVHDNISQARNAFVLGAEARDLQLRASRRIRIPVRTFSGDSMLGPLLPTSGWSTLTAGDAWHLIMTPPP